MTATAQWEQPGGHSMPDALPQVEPDEPGILRTNALLLCGLGAAVIGIALGLIAHRKPLLAAAGWVIASFGCLGSVAGYSYRDAKRRAADWLAATQSRGVGRFAVLAVGVVAIVVNAWQFADWAAR